VTDIKPVGLGASDEVHDPMLTPRGWWTKADAGKAESPAAGLKESLQHLRNYLARERFDVGLFVPPLLELTDVGALKGYLRFQVRSYGSVLCTFRRFLTARERRFPSLSLQLSVAHRV
jgi:hypothetical protein